MFKKIGDFFEGVFNSVTVFLKQPIPNAIWHAALGGAASYATMNGLHFDHASLTAVCGAALGGVLGWARGSGSPSAQEIAALVDKALANKTQAGKP